MKSKLCSVLVVLFIAMSSATAAHADETDAVGMEETVSETGEPADPVTALRDRKMGEGLMTAAPALTSHSITHRYLSRVNITPLIGPIRPSRGTPAF